MAPLSTGEIFNEIDMTVAKARRWQRCHSSESIAVPVHRCEETFLDGDFDQEPSHADGRVGERNFAGVGGTARLVCATARKYSRGKKTCSFLIAALDVKFFTTKEQKTRRF
jgi:hypothetical protein